MQQNSCIPLASEEQTGLILSLVRQNRSPQTLLDFPSPADLEEMLGDAAIRANTELWDGEAGMKAFAILDPSCATLIFEALAGPHQPDYEQEAIAWGCRRADELHLADPLETGCRQADTGRQQRLIEAGFLLLEECTLVYERSLEGNPPNPVLPPGFSIRPLIGKVEIPAIVELYHTAHSSSQLSESYWLAMMSAPSYLPEGDLVVEDPGGRLAASCVCWISREENLLSGRLVGHTDPIVVRPDCRRMGLAAALLQTGFRLLRDMGMDTACLSTSSTDRAAVRAFESAGFRLMATRLRFARQAARR